MSNKDSGRDVPPMEDYGSPATDDDMSTTPAESGSTGGAGKYAGGTAGTHQGSGEGEQFGEFENTGTGVDLTEEMENTDARSGLVKGGEHGADDVAGLAQYGGKAGGLEGND